MLYNRGYRKLIGDTQDRFLKQRYLFLVMRLYHYYGEFPQELKLYEKYKSVIIKGSIVDEWITALRAGAFERMHKMVEANMLLCEDICNP